MKCFDVYGMARVGAPSLKDVEGEGECAKVDVRAHVQATQGINVWAGMSRTGIPLDTDGPVTYGPGMEARKARMGGEITHANYPGPFKADNPEEY